MSSACARRNSALKEITVRTLSLLFIAAVSGVLLLESTSAADPARDAGSKLRGEAFSGQQLRTYQNHARDYSRLLYYSGQTADGLQAVEAQRQVQAIQSNVKQADQALDKIQAAHSDDPSVKQSVEKIKQRHAQVAKHCEMLDGECRQASLNGAKICDCCLDIEQELDVATKETGALLKQIDADKLPALKRSDNTTSEKPSIATGPIQATFLITGLHCPPCAGTAAGGVRGIKGVKSVSVDWNTKSAKVSFDESVVSAQKIADAFARTPHMMGGNMQYGAWLALKVDGVKDEATAKKAKDVLSAVKGVSRVAVYPAQESVGVAFAADGKLNSAELIAALNEAGLKSRLLP